MSARANWDVVVVGSVNTDYLVRTDRLPLPGETVKGDELITTQGGKGANQAVAAARLGAKVALVAKVGADERGDVALAALQREGVNTRYVVRDANVDTGAALIIVDQSGEKYIISVSNANNRMTVADVQAAAVAISHAQVVISQLEVPLDCVQAAAQLAHDGGVSFMLDPAPAFPLPDELLRLVSLIKPNDIEALTLTGIAVSDRTTARLAAQALIRRGVKAVAAPTGDAGNLLVWDSSELWLPRIAVNSVDATGAGDAFIAALGVMLAEGKSLADAGPFASAAAALTTTAFGAQNGLTDRHAVQELLNQTRLGTHIPPKTLKQWRCVMLKLAWKAPPEQYPPLEMLDYAIAAEKAGFDALEASDHFHPWSDDGQASFVWTWLGAVAARTSKIELGTGITCPILRYHPAIIAQAAATLATMAPNRAFLCVGTGEALNEYAAVGKWPGYNQRQQMLTEAIHLIRELWTGEETSFVGTYYQTKKARLYTYPQQPIPLYVSTLVPESATFAGQFGDGLITVGGEEDDTYRQMLKNFAQGASQAGRDAAKAVKMIEINVAYTDDVQGAIEMQKKYWAGTMVPALFDQKIYTPRDSAKNGKAVGNDTIQQKMCISADPETHIQNAQRYIDLGFNYIVFHCPGPDQNAFLTGYGRDVLHHLREGKDHAAHFQQDNAVASDSNASQYH